MNNEKMRQQIHLGIDRRCAALTSDPYRVQRVLNMARAEGERAVKRKLSLGLVFLLILMLTGTAALAAALLWQDYVPQMKQTEHKLGDYAEWPAARRIQLAKDMVVMGYLHETDDTLILSSKAATEQEKAAAADMLMLKLTGQQDVKEIHSTLITYAIMGHEDTWTPEQRVWWNGIVNMYAPTDAQDTLIVPTKEDLSEADAVAIAKAAIQEAYGFENAYMDSLHPVTNLYVTKQRPNYKRWDIQFKKYREGSDSYLEKVYCAVVDEDGKVISDSDVGIEHPIENAARANARNENTENSELAKVYERYGNLVGAQSIWRLTLEEKAELLGNDNGIPRREDISEADAVQKARSRLSSIGYDLTTFETSVWYKLYDADATGSLPIEPFYVIYFVDDLDQPVKAFTVTIDAATGEVRKTYTPGSPSEQ